MALVVSLLWNSQGPEWPGVEGAVSFLVLVPESMSFMLPPSDALLQWDAMCLPDLAPSDAFLLWNPIYELVLQFGVNNRKASGGVTEETFMWSVSMTQFHLFYQQKKLHIW